MLLREFEYLVNDSIHGQKIEFYLECKMYMVYIFSLCCCPQTFPSHCPISGVPVFQEVRRPMYGGADSLRRSCLTYIS